MVRVHWENNYFGCLEASISSKERRGLGLLYLKVRSIFVLAGHIWNIHLIADLIWIQWVHYVYLSSSII